MKPEDAYYYKILLISGITDGYDEWLNNCLESEISLSEETLELALCGEDINKRVICLNRYCEREIIDEAQICEMLRLFLKEAYHTQRFSKKEVADKMYRFVMNRGKSIEINFEIWRNMYYISDCYDLAEIGVVSWDNFDAVFFAYLDDGVPFVKDSLY